MKHLCKVSLALACAPIVLAGFGHAQQPSAANAGKAMVASKCFQCHSDAMFRDARQDRRGWEATIYRMVGRGGVYTQDEIKVMADYLADTLGPGAKPVEPAK